MTLNIHHLAFSRNNTYLFNDLDFELNAGEMLQVCGDNGCGKSTLLRMIAGFIQPESGDILWKGKNIFHTLDDYVREILYLGHQNGIKSHLTVSENLKFICALANIKLHNNLLKTVLHAMKLSHLEKTQANYLSAGQKRRLALARLQLIPACLWVLDEPATALDNEGQSLLLTNLLKQHLMQGGMAIVATHHDAGMTSKILNLSAKEIMYV